MTWTKLISDYFEWLCEFAYQPNIFPVSYKKLFKKLFSTEFIHQSIDINRALDGVYLRYRYSDTEGINEMEAEKEFDIFPCTVLEALIALALRCEDDIMGDTAYGDRTGQWFWEMLSSIGLSKYNDDNYDEEEVDRLIDMFLYRNYGPNGEGCAFRSSDGEDMRNIDLWYQMQRHLIDISGGNTR